MRDIVMPLPVTSFPISPCLWGVIIMGMPLLDSLRHCGWKVLLLPGAVLVEAGERHTKC